jgi:hypothetical protein
MQVWKNEATLGPVLIYCGIECFERATAPRPDTNLRQAIRVDSLWPATVREPIVLFPDDRTAGSRAHLPLGSFRQNAYSLDENAPELPSKAPSRSGDLACREFRLRFDAREPRGSLTPRRVDDFHNVIRHCNE